MQLIKLLIVSSIICALNGCAILQRLLDPSIERPNALLCVVNAPIGSTTPHKDCWNMKTDYDANGKKLPGVKPMVMPLNSLNDLNKTFSMDPDSWAAFIAYTKKQAYSIEQTRSGN